MKILIHSNGPTVGTGYGVQTAHLVRRLMRHGHEVAVSVTYGQEGSVGEWATGELDANGEPLRARLYPRGFQVNGVDVIHLHAAHWFSDGEDTPDADTMRNGWIMPLLDVWALNDNPRLSDFNVAAWTPVDHSPVPPIVREFFIRNPDAVPIAMSRFGERELFAAGLNPAYVPLSVDTKRIRPTPEIPTPDGGTVTARELFGIPEGAFVVGMVAMNKEWQNDRKGFNEAFRAFALFHAQHPDSVLFMHSDKWGGMGGLNLVELANACGIPQHVIVWTDQYAYRMGLPPEMMAAAFSAMNVLLAPSHGEGFCVPLIEAQACGTPVIATNATSQPELVGAGWLVKCQPAWNPPMRSNYAVPDIADIVRCLNECYELPLEERRAMSQEAWRLAQTYDADRVFDEHWLPLLERLDKIQRGETLPLERAPMERCDVIVPMMRWANVERFYASLAETTGEAVLRPDPLGPPHAADYAHGRVLVGEAGRTYAENVNACYAQSDADFVLIVGDDTEFAPGWFEAAQAVSETFDVIGTNDTTDRVRNPDVAAGRHADHFYVRRAYVDVYGACLDGPGVLAPEAYGHWYTDKEIVELAKARRVWTPCLGSIIVHHHPGYDGNEAARSADPLYVAAVERAEADRDTWLSRVALIQMQRI